MSKYFKLADNFHLFTNSADRFKTELNLTFSAGGAYFEKSHQKGLSHLLEHCEIVETKNLNREAMNQFVFQKDLYKNAATYRLMKDITLSGHKEDIDSMLDLIFEFAFDTSISEETFKLEKEIVLKEINQRKGDPNFKLGELFRKKVYTEDSKYQVDILGDAESLISKTKEDLLVLRQEIMKRSHFVLTGVGGNIDEEKIKARFSNFIKNFATDEASPIDFEPGNRLNDFDYLPIVSEFAHENCEIDLYIPLELNFSTRTKNNILAEFLFFYPEGIFYKILREQLGLIYSLDYSFDESGNFLFMSLLSEVDKAKELVEIVKDILSNPEKYITEEKVEIIKSLYVKRQELASDNPYNPVDFSVNTLMNYGIVQTYEDYLKELEKASYKDILDSANKIKNSLPKMQIVTVSRDKAIEKLKL